MNLTDSLLGAICLVFLLVLLGTLTQERAASRELGRSAELMGDLASAAGPAPGIMKVSSPSPQDRKEIPPYSGKPGTSAPPFRIPSPTAGPCASSCAALPQTARPLFWPWQREHLPPGRETPDLNGVLPLCTRSHLRKNFPEEDTFPYLEAAGMKPHFRERAPPLPCP